MSRYWTWSNNLTPGETARASEVAGNFSDAANGLSSVEAEMDRALRVASGDGLTQHSLELQETAAQRAGKIIGFGATGNELVAKNGAFKWRGAWATATVFAENDIVSQGLENSLWLCILGHTSSGSFATDSPTKWVKIIDLTEVRRAIRTFKKISAADSPYAAAAGDDLMVDVTVGAVTITLPVAPNINDQPISIVHVAGNITANNILVGRNGQVIMGLAENMTINDQYAAMELAYCDGTLGWRLVRGV